MKRYGVDSAHSWLIAVAATFVMLTTVGQSAGSFGVLYKAFLDIQHFTEQEASWPSSMQTGMIMFTGPVCAYLSTRLSVRSLSILGVVFVVLGYCVCYYSTNLFFLCCFYGVVSGLGVYIPTIILPALISKSFKKYRVTAMGMLLMGIPLGLLIFPWITKILLECYGLNGTFLLLGAIHMQAFIGSVLLVEYEHDQNDVNQIQLALKHDTKLTSSTGEDDQKRNLRSTSFNTVSCNVKASSAEMLSYNLNTNDTAIKESFACRNSSYTVDEEQKIEPRPKSDRLSKRLRVLVKSPYFYICFAFQNVTLLINYMYPTIILDYATKKNISYSESLSLLLIFSLVQIFGRMGLGWISDKNLIPKTVNISISFCLISIACFLLPLVFQYEWLVFVTILYSTLLGNLIPLSNVMFAEYLPQEDLILAYSLSRSLGGVIALLRSTIIGAFSGGSSSYDRLFIFLGCLAVISSLMMLTDFLRKKVCLQRKL